MFRSGPLPGLGPDAAGETAESGQPTGNSIPGSGFE
jgi:hypothetical protein